MFATNNGLKNTRYIVLILSPPTRQTTSDKMCTVWLRMDPSVLSVTKNIYIFTFFFCQLKCINISKPRIQYKAGEEQESAAFARESAATLYSRPTKEIKQKIKDDDRISISMRTPKSSTG